MMDFASSSSAGSPSQAPRRNTLTREGIAPSMARGSPSNDQQRAERRGSAMQKIVKENKPVGMLQLQADEYLRREDWVPLGEGWYQVTPAGSGSSRRCGVHSVIEGMKFMCCYEPRTKEGFAACTSSSPEYDLELQVKHILSRSPAISTDSISSFQIAIAIKSPLDYVALTSDLGSQYWTLSCVKDGIETVMADVPDVTLRANTFSAVLLQVRGHFLSIDVNGVPVFTSIRPEYGNYQGLLGLCSKNAKFAVKGWKMAKPGRLAGVNESIPSKQYTPPVPPKSYNAYKHSENNKAASTGTMPPGPPSKSVSLAQLLNNQQRRPSSGRNVSNPVMNAINKVTTAPYAFSRLGGEAVPTGGGGPGRPAPAKTAPQPSQSSATSPATVTANDFDETGAEPVSELHFEDDTRTVTDFGDAPQGSSMYAYLMNKVRAAETRLSMEEMRLPGMTPEASPQSVPTQSAANRMPEPSGSFYEPSFETNNTEDKIAYCGAALLQSHDKAIVEMVMRDVIQVDLGVSFDDIAALDTAKRLLNEAVMLPLLMPEFFTGIREPWKGVLLFGPPGTGKTLLAKAVCSLNSSTFFSCSSSSLISKFRGESEKIVRCLFEAARICAPSVVFLDEVDALVSSRSAEGEHEASRRLKTEFFAQMDGITSGRGSTPGSGVMVLATTNCPWDLDEAIRRRLEKRIHIPLPDVSARCDLFRRSLKDIPHSPDVLHCLQALAEKTGGYSCADIYVVCREASMMPMRRLIAVLDPIELHAMRKSGQLDIPRVTMEDFIKAVENTKPSVSKAVVEKCYEWEDKFGSY